MNIIKDLICEIEENIPVNKWEFLGIKIWPLVRLTISTDLGGEINTQRVQASGFLDQIKELCKKISYSFKVVFSKFLDYKMNRIEKNSSVLLLGRSSSRNTLWKGKWLDPNLDSMRYYLKKMGKKSIHLEFDFLGLTRIPRYSPSLFIHNIIQFSKIKAYMQNLLHKTQKLNIPKYPEFIQILKSHNINLSIMDKNKIRYYVYLLRIRANYFKWFIKKHHSELGMCTGYYIPEHLAFILACFESSIPSVDIQHGLQGEFLSAYSEWKHEYRQLLPTSFWVWTEFEKDYIQNWAHETSPFPYLGGNLWLDFCSNAENGEIRKFLKEIRHIKTNEYNSHILLSLQPNNTLDYFFNIIKQSPKTWFWWIRLHPRMLEQIDELIQLLEQNNILNYSVTEASQFPLPLILKNVDVHITYNSTVVIDADQFNLKSIVLDENGSDYFPQQFQKGVAYYERSTPDIVNRLDFLLKSTQDVKITSTKDTAPVSRLEKFFALLNL
ncbi:MAG: hypothetical protein JW776_11120 [Candidatus Lokiarchaeota archaeon]|nr:hypothetical protein [Candidatus Lokiarchaeota archaeon]